MEVLPYNSVADMESVMGFTCDDYRDDAHRGDYGDDDYGDVMECVIVAGC